MEGHGQKVSLTVHSGLRSEHRQVTIDYVMMTTGARYGTKIDSTKAGLPFAKQRPERLAARQLTWVVISCVLRREDLDCVLL